VIILLLGPCAWLRWIQIMIRKRSLGVILPMLMGIGYSAEVFEANNGRETELPKGKEADGIRGDFVLRSDKVEALVSQNAPNRRANMSTFYGDDGVTPGCLYDLALRGSENDQLVCYAPTGYGPVSYVRIVEGANKKSGAVESVKTAASNKGIYHREVYRVQDGVQGVFITSTLRNESDQPQKINTKSSFVRFEKQGDAEEGLYYASSVDPADKAGYALTMLKLTGAEKVGGSIELAPGAEVVIERFIAVGNSPVEALGAAMEAKGEKLGTLTGSLLDGAGQPVVSGSLMVPFAKASIPLFPDANGKFSVQLRPGSYTLTAEDMGRKSATYEVTVSEGKSTTLMATMEDAARIAFDIKDEEGRSLPCKAMFEGISGTASPDLGPVMRARGCKDQYHSGSGQFTVALPPGSYRVRVVRGLEYASLEKEVTLTEGQSFDFSGVLRRIVDTTGWISADFHNHTTQSGDNICGVDDRLINIAAENIEFAPTTEHNRLYDWEPHIKRLGLDPWIKTLKGIELTGRRQHFNAFPFEPDPYLQDGGAPLWNDDPRITAITLRRHQGENATRWIQFNHPDLTNMFHDRDGNGIADGGFVGVGMMIDGMETQNGNETNILEGAPYRITRSAGSLTSRAAQVREFMWLQLLNQGVRATAVAVADAHAVYGNGVGGWLTYLPSSTDQPPAISWDELAPRAKGGQILLTNGPFMTITTQDGQAIGADIQATGSLRLDVKVQGTDWVQIDRVQVLVNSRPEPKLNFTRSTHPDMFKDGVMQFSNAIDVPLHRDSHLIVVALGDNSTLIGGYGTSTQSRMKPCAYNNPIYVDVDGNGFQPNGDTLGFDLPVMGTTADQARELLKRGGKEVKEVEPRR
jgi:hypothetical protein